MKKLIIALAAIAVAVCTNAATVKWTSGTYNNGFTGPDGKTMKNLETYTAVCTFFSDSAGDNALGSSSVVKGNVSGAYTTTYGYDESSRPSEYNFAAKGTYYAQIVITGKDADGKEWTRSTDIAAFTVPETGAATPNFATGDMMAVSGNHWGEWSSVPEPTSGMLLLLGAAGLALRRRRA